MRPFVHDDFLLESETARELYHGTAKHRDTLIEREIAHWRGQ